MKKIVVFGLFTLCFAFAMDVSAVDGGNSPGQQPTLAYVESEECGVFPGPGPQDDVIPADPAACAYGNAPIPCNLWVCPDYRFWTGADPPLLGMGCVQVGPLAGPFNEVPLQLLLPPGGMYDLVLDCNSNGFYDPLIDALDDNDEEWTGFGVGFPPARSIESELCNEQAGPGPTVEEFAPSGAGCAYGTTLGAVCDIWVCPDFDTWTLGVFALAPLGCNNVTPVSGVYSDVPVGVGPGVYDLVLDCDRDGNFDGTPTWDDALDDHDITTTEGGFYITPEPVAFVLFAAGTAALYGFARVRRKK